jgi:alpha-mannosidase
MEKKAYVVATAHLDTVWRWNLAQTIKEFIPDTLEKNAELIKKYPHYRFNFEGAFRYKLMEEYYPEAFEQLKKLVAEANGTPSEANLKTAMLISPLPRRFSEIFCLATAIFKRNSARPATIFSCLTALASATRCRAL